MSEAIKQGLRDRFYGLSESTRAFREIHDEPNPEIWLRGILEGDLDDAEALISEIEAKNAEIQPSADEIAKDAWEFQIRRALRKAKISESGLLEALVRKEFFGDTSRIDALKSKLEEINTGNPRP